MDCLGKASKVRPAKNKQMMSFFCAVDAAFVPGDVDERDQVSVAQNALTLTMVTDNYKGMGGLYPDLDIRIEIHYLELLRSIYP